MVVMHRLSQIGLKRVYISPTDIEIARYVLTFGQKALVLEISLATKNISENDQSLNMKSPDESIRVFYISDIRETPPQ